MNWQQTCRLVTAALFLGLAAPALADDTTSAREKELAGRIAAARKKLADKPRDDGPPRQELARAYLALGTLHLEAKKAAQAEAPLRTALELAQDLVRDFPQVVSYRADLATAYDAIGRTCALQAKLADAEQSHRQAFAIWEKSALEDPNPAFRHGAARSMLNLSRVQLDCGKIDAAMAHLRGSIQALTTLEEDSKDRATYLPDLHEAYYNLAVALRQSGRVQEAAAVLAKSKELGARLKKLNDKK